MADAKKPKLPTGAEIRAQIEAAEREILSSTVALCEALVVQLAVPERDVTPEQFAVDAAKRRAEQLKLILPSVERAEEASREETRAKLAEETAEASGCIPATPSETGAELRRPPG